MTDLTTVLTAGAEALRERGMPGDEYVAALLAEAVPGSPMTGVRTYAYAVAESVLGELHYLEHCGPCAEGERTGTPHEGHTLIIGSGEFTGHPCCCTAASCHRA